MSKKNKNKIIENSLIIASGVGGLLGFLYKQAIYLAFPVASIAIYLNGLHRDKYQEQIENLNKDLHHLEERFNSNIEYFEDSIQALPNNMISYYTQRLAPLISQLQSQQKMNQEAINILQKDFRENWQFISDLGKRIDEIDEDFQQRPEVEEIRKIKGVLTNIYHSFRKYVTNETFQEELINITQSLSNHQEQIKTLLKEAATLTDRESQFEHFAKNEELKRIEEKLNKYVTNKEFQEYHERVCKLIEQNSSSIDQRLIEEIEGQLAHLQISINNFVTIDTLAEITDHLISKEEAEDLKLQVNQVSQQLEQNENLTILTKIKGILERLVQQEDLANLEKQFQLLQHNFNQRPELKTIENLQVKIEEINKNILPFVTLEDVDHFIQEFLADGKINRLAHHNLSGMAEINHAHYDNISSEEREPLLSEKSDPEIYLSSDFSANFISENHQYTREEAIKYLQSQINSLYQQLNYLLDMPFDENESSAVNELINRANLTNEHLAYLQELKKNILVLEESLQQIPSQEQIDQLTSLLQQLNQVDDPEEISTFNHEQFVKIEEFQEFKTQLVKLVSNTLEEASLEPVAKLDQKYAHLQEQIDQIILISSDDNTLNEDGIDLENLQVKLMELQTKLNNCVSIESFLELQNQFSSFSEQFNNSNNTYPEHFDDQKLEELKKDIINLKNTVQHMVAHGDFQFLQEQVNELMRIIQNSHQNQLDEEYVEIITSLALSLEESIDLFVTHEQLQTVEDKIDALSNLIEEKSTQTSQENQTLEEVQTYLELINQTLSETMANSQSIQEVQENLQNQFQFLIQEFKVEEINKVNQSLSQLQEQIDLCHEKIDILPSVEQISDLIIFLKTMISKQEINGKKALPSKQDFPYKKELHLVKKKIYDYIIWKDLA